MNNKKTHIFNNTGLPTDISLIDFCHLILQQVDLNPELRNTPDYHFAQSILFWESREYDLHRQSLLSLLLVITQPIPAYINELVQQTHVFKLSERTLFFNTLERNDVITKHTYYELIHIFIKEGMKGMGYPYFNCLLKLITQNKKNPDSACHDTFSSDVLLDFYEFLHPTLLTESRIADNTLRKFTSALGSIIDDNEKSQSLYFYLFDQNSYRNNEIVFEYATKFLSAPNLSTNTSYKKELSIGAVEAAIRWANWKQYDYWLDILEPLVDGDDPELLLLKESAEEVKASELERIEHPLNPKNIIPTPLNSISTKDLIFLSALIDSCGDDWGFSFAENKLRYVFPSKEMTKQLLNELFTKQILKVKTSDFNLLSDKEIYTFDIILKKCKSHLNIDGVTDTKSIALKLVKEEIFRRTDINENILIIWQQIVSGYFYSNLRACLDDVTDSWPDNFLLNTSTLERIATIHADAGRMCSAAFISVQATSGAERMKKTRGIKHTQNLLIHNINNGLNWVEKNLQEKPENPRTRYKGLPVLSIEKILNELRGLTPEMIFLEIPSIDFLEQAERI